ncbi:MAG TPA: hypothetical protein VD867_04660 [Burkholderiales bacterium]|nr:hypothetical protein [Burkholderiales bacterium]
MLSRLSTLVFFLGLLALSIYLGQSATGAAYEGYENLILCYPILLIAYLPLLAKAYQASTAATLVPDTDLAGTHKVIHEVFYKDFPYLNPFFPLLLFTAHISGQRTPNEVGALPLRALLGRRLQDGKYLIWQLLLGWIYFVYLTSPDTSVFGRFVIGLGEHAGAAVYNALLALLQFNLIFDLALTLFYRLKFKGPGSGPVSD